VDGAQESSQFHIEMLAERTEKIMVVATFDSDLYLTQEISCKNLIYKFMAFFYRKIY
jgi:hypothetical protein